MSTERLLILRTVLFTFKVEVHSHPSNRKSPVLIITGPKMLFTAPSAVSGGPVKGSPLSHVGGRTSRRINSPAILCQEQLWLRRSSQMAREWTHHEAAQSHQDAYFTNNDHPRLSEFLSNVPRIRQLKDLQEDRDELS